MSPSCCKLLSVTNRVWAVLFGSSVRRLHFIIFALQREELGLIEPTWFVHYLMKVNESFRVSYLFLELLIYFVKCSIDYVPTLFGSQNHFFFTCKIWVWLGSRYIKGYDDGINTIALVLLRRSTRQVGCQGHHQCQVSKGRWAFCRPRRSTALFRETVHLEPWDRTTLLRCEPVESWTQIFKALDFV